jgi:hypothetical protein
MVPFDSASFRSCKDLLPELVHYSFPRRVSCLEALCLEIEITSFYCTEIIIIGYGPIVSFDTTTSELVKERFDSTISDPAAGGSRNGSDDYDKYEPHLSQSKFTLLTGTWPAVLGSLRPGSNFYDPLPSPQFIP